MDENNNITNQENEFVMRDTTVSQPQEDTTYRWSRAQQGTDQSQNTQYRYSQTAQTETAQNNANNNANTYRFQNPVNEAPKKEKHGMSMPKMIAGAVVFGIVAALCFSGVTALIHAVSGGSSSGSDSIGSTSVSVVSGAAATTNDVSGIVDQVMPSIVAITEKSTETSYFGQTYSSEGAGSGFIVKQDDDQLLIVTNNHVVDGADEISVQFNDGEVADAEIKGNSEANDLAVITVDLKKLKDSTKKSIRVASLGSSDDAKVGQMVIAIGNALGYGQSVTVGYVSAKNREVTTSDSTSGSSTTQILLQTDAAINPGNSGGALIDTNGNVIGINSSKYMSYGSTNVEGMGYAIPMSDAVSVINDLMNREVLKDDERGYLGITGRSISDSVSEYYGIPVGVYVVSVSENGAAAKAGIKQGDVITKINGTTVKTIDAVQEIVNNIKVGTKIEVTIKRSNDGEYVEKKMDVTLKNKDTLEGLEDDSDSSSNSNSNNKNSNGDGYDYNNEYNNGYGNGSGNGSQVVPWGGSGY